MKLIRLRYSSISGILRRFILFPATVRACRMLAFDCSELRSDTADYLKENNEKRLTRERSGGKRKVNLIGPGRRCQC